MWCIGKITEEYRQRMYDLLELYAIDYQKDSPVICVDEKSKQLIKQTRKPLPMVPGRCQKEDYEYKRCGTRNIFLAVEPRGKWRHVKMTERRQKKDFVDFIQSLVIGRYAKCKTIHLVLDNLNTHFRRTFVEILGKAEANRILRKVRFHYTPKHASWLNMAEIEIGIMDRQCTGRRIGEDDELSSELAAWERRRNKDRRGIEWKFTRQDADNKLSRHYVA
jgi:hypothetical protein